MSIKKTPCRIQLLTSLFALLFCFGANMVQAIPATTAAQVTLSDLTQIYDGSAKNATITTVPDGLTYSATYNGSTAPTEVGSYTVIATVTDPLYTGSATDTFAIVDAPIAVDPLPASLATGYSSTATLAVNATGTHLNYAWRSNGVFLVDGSAISGATTDTLQVKSVTRTNAASYDVVITNSAYAVTSSVTALTINDPVMVYQPTNVAVLKGQNHVFVAEAVGSGVLKYQWYSIGNGISALLKGKTSNVLAVVLNNANLGYYAIVTNQAPAPNSVTSRVATVTMLLAPAITGQPASYAGKAGKIAGNNVTFSVKVATNATQPLSYQWYKDSQILTGEVATNLTLINVQSGDAGSYACTVTNAVGSATTKATAGLLDVLADTNAPTAVFTYPATGQRLTNGQPYTLGETTLTAPQFSLAGSVTDKGLVSTIIVKRIYPETDTVCVSETIPGPGKVGWTNALTLQDGTNIFITYAVDYAGNRSKTNTRAFFYVNNTIALSVTNLGYGTNIPVGKAVNFTKYGTPTNGAPLEIGRNYTIKAIADGNNVFTNWSMIADTTVCNYATFVTTNPVVTFRMASNLVLFANFITNPIVAAGAQGKYNGLFIENDGPTLESAGSILNLNVKTNRSFSGKLNLQGKTISIANTFDTSGDVTFNVSRASTLRSNLTVQLHLDWGCDCRQVTGFISSTNSDGVPWNAEVTLDQATFNPTNNAYPSGRYTVTMQSDDTSGTNGPAGAGYFALTNTTSGNAILIGKLADGTAIAQTVPISQDDYFPVCIKLYNGLGLLLGWMENNGPEVDGELRWIRNATNKPVTYTQGFTNDIEPFGFFYSKPTLPQTVFGADTNLVVTVFDSEGFSLDNQGLPLLWNVQLKGNSFLVMTNGSSTNKLTGTVKASDGTVTLTFKTTGTDKTGTKTMNGILLQGIDIGSGYFIGGTNTGGFILGPFFENPS